MTNITQTEAYLIELRNLVEPKDVLEKHGYITRLRTDEELLLRRRCLGCGKAMSQLVSKGAKRSEHLMPANETDEATISITTRTLSLNDQTVFPTISSFPTNLPAAAFNRKHPSIGQPAPVPTFRCKYHPGNVVHKYWTCCNQHVTSKPCGGSEMHTPRPDAIDELTTQHQFHLTPSAPSRGTDIRAAVSLDCEMGTASSGDSELIRVTLIDYFSGAVLVNNIVDPDVPMQHLNTRFSGVSWADIRKAKREGSCLKGKEGARRALWRYVGPETVVVGHGVSNDLRSLRWIHMLIVDSFVTEFSVMKRKEAENAYRKESEYKILDSIEGSSLLETNNNNGGTLTVHRIPHNGDGSENPTNMGKKKTGHGRGNLSLKNLVEKRLHREIQTGGRLGHDSLEDAIAARDLVHWIIMNPDYER